VLEPIQTGTGSGLFGIPFSVITAIIGALLGSYGTYRGRVRREEKRKKDKVTNLRIGLRTELVQVRSYKDNLKNLTGRSGVAYELLRATSVSTTVFESNINEIMELSEREISLLFALYSEIIASNHGFRAVAETSLTGDSSPTIHGIEEYVARMEPILDAAIDELEENLDDDVNLDIIDPIVDED
jgi:hypothetical protein